MSASGSTGTRETRQSDTVVSSVIGNDSNVILPGDIPPENIEPAFIHEATGSESYEKRQRLLTRKALQNAVQNKHSELTYETKTLTRAYDKLCEALTSNSQLDEALSALRTSTKAYTNNRLANWKHSTNKTSGTSSKKKVTQSLKIANEGYK